MKKYIYILLMVLLFGCEKIIEVDLNDVRPAIVIEGNLIANELRASVKISKTANYFGLSEPEKISGAKVEINNNAGRVFKLSETEKGLYENDYVFPEYGETFNLTVEFDGEIYEASSTLNPPVRIDSLNYYYNEGFAFIDEGYYLYTQFADPPVTSNYYRLKVYKNGNYKNNINNFILFDDRFADGKSLKIRIVQRVFKAGQEATVELISLDKGAYEYYKTFQELISINPGSAAPANPTSNISNGALGYFSAWSSSSKSIVISE